MSSIRLPGFRKSVERVVFKGIWEGQIDPATPTTFIRDELRWPNPTKRIQSRKWLDFLFLKCNVKMYLNSENKRA